MVRTRTTKAVAQRIDLNYFKRATPFKRAKLWLAILAPVLALVWIGWHFFASDHRVYSSGRLSEAHAVLEKECTACHVREARGFSAKAADSACLACHDGPSHHSEMTASNAPKPACAECHAEHRGRDNVMAASTQNCAKCHSALPKVMIASGNLFAHSIFTFQNGHPDFAVLRAAASVPPKDTGTIKLNHALHVNGIRRGPTGPIVKLECGDCHRTYASKDRTWTYGGVRSQRDSQAAPQSLAAAPSFGGASQFVRSAAAGLLPPHPRSGRELMASPKFLDACAGCHLLTFDQRFEDGVPHDKPEVIHAFLQKRFTEYISAHASELHEMRIPRRELAGRQSEATTRTLTVAQWVAKQVAISEELLWHKTCAHCHAISLPLLANVEIARWDFVIDGQRIGKSEPAMARPAVVVTKLPTVFPSNIADTWLPNARFDHDAHAGFSCVGCHQKTLTSTDSSDILIPGIAVCQTCHAPGPTYASDRCSECHTYHDWSKRKEVKPVFTLPELRGGS